MQVAGAGACLLVVFLTGFWLTRSGKPYGGLVLNLHKLLSLAALALLVIAAVRQAPLSALELTVTVVAGVLFLDAIVSGGLASVDRPTPAFVLVMHRIAPFVALAAVALTAVLLLSGVR
jgi:hypothetical protein